jgi:predicted lipoprotein with Yx(FWY)xxD motif
MYTIGVIMMGLVLAAGCGSDGTSTAGPTTSVRATSTPTTTSSTTGTITVTVGSSSLGAVLTDQSGRTLYGFTSDTGGTSTCTGDCTRTWPPLASKAPVASGPGVDTALLSSTRRADGTSQVVYGKWPLYYFAGDIQPGDVKGQGAGGTWFAVAPNGQLIKTGQATVTPSASHTPSATKPESEPQPY